MQEVQEGFNLAVWFSKLTIRDWLVGLVCLLVLVGPGLFGRSKPVEPPAPVPPPNLVPIKKARKNNRRKKSSRPKKK